MLRRVAATAAVVALLVVGLGHPAGAAPKDKVPMHDFATGEPVTGAFSMLERAEDSIATKIRTGDIGGNAYTAWYVIFNAPAECSDGVCGEDDIFNEPGNPGAGFNADQIEAARISVVFGNAGAVANAAGRLQLDGGLAEGEVPAGPNQVVIGRSEDGALVPLGVVTGLEDAVEAELHIVLLDHGAAHEDPAKLEMQLTRFNGACNPDCRDAQFAVHLP